MATAHDPERALYDLVATGARFYQEMTKQALQELGDAGGGAMRQATREYMDWRGKQMRAAHESMGVPINVESITNYWDSASGLACKQSAVTMSPHYVVKNLTTCPLFDVWKEGSFQIWGNIFCNEAHQALASAYHKDAVVVIHENMLKGDPACHFQWVMPPDEEALEHAPAATTEVSPEAANERDNWREPARALNRASRLLGGQVYFASAVLSRRFGERGDQVFRRGLRRYAALRAAAMKKAHTQAGRTLGVAALSEDFDLPISIAWDFASEAVEDGRYSAEVTRCPMADAWRDLDGMAQGAVYCKEVYPSLASAYTPGLRAQAVQSIAAGNSTCVIKFGL